MAANKSKTDSFAEYTASTSRTSHVVLRWILLVMHYLMIALSLILISTLFNTNSTAAVNDTANDFQIDEWFEVFQSENDSPGKNFTFAPRKTPGVQPHVLCESELSYFTELLSSDIIDHIFKMINDSVKVKCRMNNPAKRRSLFCRCSDVDKPEFYKFLAILISTGVEEKLSVKDYWSTHPSSETPFYKNIMPRDNFEAIYHTMMHAGEADAKDKQKIEPLIKKFVSKFQQALYPYENIAIDEMVIGWKGHWKQAIQRY